MREGEGRLDAFVITPEGKIFLRWIIGYKGCRFAEHSQDIIYFFYINCKPYTCFQKHTRPCMQTNYYTTPTRGNLNKARPIGRLHLCIANKYIDTVINLKVT